MSPDRRLVLLLAARADCNVKTARRALVEGVDSIKGANLRDRLREALAQLAPSPKGAVKGAVVMTQPGGLAHCSPRGAAK